MDKQPGPTVWHRGLCSVSCGSLDGRGVWGRVDTYVCVTVSLLCTWNYHSAVNWLYSSIKQKVEKKQSWIHSDVKTWLIDGEGETNPPRRNIPKNSGYSAFIRPQAWHMGCAQDSMESRKTNFTLEKHGRHYLGTRSKPASIVINHAGGIYPCCDETDTWFCDLPPWNTQLQTSRITANKFQ